MFIIYIPNRKGKRFVRPKELLLHVIPVIPAGPHFFFTFTLDDILYPRSADNSAWVKA